MTQPRRTEQSTSGELVSSRSFDVYLSLAEIAGGLRRRLEEQESPILRLPSELHFRPGINLLVGKNGSGKTTLLHALSFAYFPEQRAELSDSDLLSRNLAIALAKSMKLEEDGVAIDIQLAGLTGSKGTTHLSQRQGVDLLLQKIIKNYDEELEITTGEFPDREGIIFCIDEPELGMDPNRHKKILLELQEFAKYAEYVFVATNSPFLFDSNLPRIDLSQPELGVFLPQEELARKLSGGFNETSFEA